MKQNIPPTVRVATIGRTIETYYDEWAVKFTHKRWMKPPKSEEEWDSMFDNLDVRDDEERIILRALITDYVPQKKGRKMFDYNLTLK